MMKHRKITAWITAIMMAAAMVPVLSYADNSGQKQAEASTENELLIIYKDDADCTEILQEEGFAAADEETNEAIEQAAEACADQIAEDTGEAVQDSTFVSDSVGEDGAVLKVTLEPGADPDAVMEAIGENPDVAYVQPNYQYQLFENAENPTASKEESLNNDESDAELQTAGATEDTTDAADGRAEEAVTEMAPPAETETGATEADALDADKSTQELMEAMSTVTNDAYLGYQYHLGPWESVHGANVLNAWDEVTTDGTVTVAVLDSGVDTSHPDLRANLDLTNAKAIQSSSVKDTDGHGTHVAGIVSAVANNKTGVAGASYNAKVLPVKISDDAGNISSAYLIEAFTYVRNAIQSGKIKNLHVINLSVGAYSIGNEAALRAIIKELRTDYDVITVCAGGNGNGKDQAYTEKVIPGDYDECFCVTALDPEGNNSVYSDYNKYKDISAPGDSIISTYPVSQGAHTFPSISGGSVTLDAGYNIESGTSMAAPLVSGIMALLWAENPNISVDDAVKAVESTAHPINKSKNYHATTGSKGAIDAAKAVDYVESHFGSVRKNIRKLKTQVKLSATSYIYNGSAKKPGVSISGLISGSDFKVAYSANKNVGTATVTITGIGAYKGTITKNFTINPKGTSLKSLKKYKKAFLVKWKKQSTQVTGYQIQYSLKKNMKSAKTVTVSGASKVKKKVAKLKKKKTYYVRVRTYKKVSGSMYYSSWSAIKSVKTK